MVTTRRTWRERLGLAKATPPATEIGYTGQPTYGTFTGDSGGRIIPDDPVAAWKLPTRWTTIEKMISDPDIAAALLAVQLPLLSVATTVEPASDDPADVEIAETISRDFDNMTTSRQQHLAEVLGYIAWGNRIFEPVYGRGDDGLWHLHKLALRPSQTISEWRVDEHGGPDGFTQLSQLGTSIDLPMDSVIVFTRSRTGGDLSGVSMLRPVYGPWLLKTSLAKTGAVAVDRHGVGIPTIRYTGNNPTERAAYQDILAGIHVHEKAYVLLPSSGVQSMADFEIKGLAGSVIDPLPQLEYHRRAVYGAFLAQFLLLGQDTGSWALSQDHSSFFLMALEALAAEVADVYNRYLIPRWVGYNWPAVPTEALPKVTFGRLDRRDVTAWMTNVVAGLQMGVIANTEDLQHLAYEYLGVPEPEPVEPEEEQPAPVADVNNPAAGTAAAPADTSGAEGTQQLTRRVWQGATVPTRMESAVKVEALGVPVAFATMAEAMDSAEARMVDRLMAVQAKQAEAAAVAMAAVYAKIQKGQADAADLAAVTVPADASTAIVREELMNVYGEGADQAAAEMEGRSGKAPKAANLAQRKVSETVVDVLAAEIGARLADRLRVALGGELLRRLGGGTADRAVLKAAADVAAKGAGKLTADLARQASSVALNTGRRETITVNLDDVEMVVYSAVMDDNTCEECAPLDGQAYPPDEAPEVPNPECLGGARCRCILIPVTADAGEEKPEVPPEPEYKELTTEKQWKEYADGQAEWARSLTPEQDLAIRNYQGLGHRLINEALRNPGTAAQQYDPEQIAKALAQASQIESAMQGRIVGENLVTFRATDTAMFSGVRIGDFIDDAGFVSTSLSRGWTENWALAYEENGMSTILRYHVPADYQGMSVDAIKDKGEKEVLLRRNTRVRVTGITEEGPDQFNMVRTIDVDVINPVKHESVDPVWPLARPPKVTKTDVPKFVYLPGDVKIIKGKGGVA